MFYYICNVILIDPTTKGNLLFCDRQSKKYIYSKRCENPLSYLRIVRKYNKIDASMIPWHCHDHCMAHKNGYNLRFQLDILHKIFVFWCANSTCFNGQIKRQLYLTILVSIVSIKLRFNKYHQKSLTKLLLMYYLKNLRFFF